MSLVLSNIIPYLSLFICLSYLIHISIQVYISINQKLYSIFHYVTPFGRDYLPHLIVLWTYTFLFESWGWSVVCVYDLVLSSFWILYFQFWYFEDPFVSHLEVLYPMCFQKNPMSFMINIFFCYYLTWSSFNFGRRGGFQWWYFYFHVTISLILYHVGRLFVKSQRILIYMWILGCHHEDS